TPLPLSAFAVKLSWKKPAAVNSSEAVENLIRVNSWRFAGHEFNELHENGHCDLRSLDIQILHSFSRAGPLTRASRCCLKTDSHFFYLIAGRGSSFVFLPIVY